MKTTALRAKTPIAWQEAVLANMDEFLPDHAAAEKKASGMAITMISHYPDRERLVLALSDLAVEEMTHYREVIRLIYSRGLTLRKDTRDAYVRGFRDHIRDGPERFFLDRLLTAGIIEARGAERFGLIAQGLPDGKLKQFYGSITRSEERHQDLFIDLARHYFDEHCVEARVDELLDVEAELMLAQPIVVALH